MTLGSLFRILYAVVAVRHLAQRGAAAAVVEPVDLVDPIDPIDPIGPDPETDGPDDPVEPTPECGTALGRKLACVPTDLRRQTCGKTASPDADASSANATDQCSEADDSSPSGCDALRRQLCRAASAGGSTIFVSDASADEDDDDATPAPTGGALVELYAPDSYYATPAILVGRSSEGTADGTEYRLRHATTNARPARVDPAFIHPYRAYEDGTRASCRAGRGEVARPCAIRSHTVRGSAYVAYDVTYLDEEEGEPRRNLHFSMVQRVLEDARSTS